MLKLCCCHATARARRLLLLHARPCHAITPHIRQMYARPSLSLLRHTHTKIDAITKRARAAVDLITPITEVAAAQRPSQGARGKSAAAAAAFADYAIIATARQKMRGRVYHIYIKRHIILHTEDTNITIFSTLEDRHQIYSMYSPTTYHAHVRKILYNTEEHDAPEGMR